MSVDPSSGARRPPTSRRGVGRHRAVTPRRAARTRLLLSAAVLLCVAFTPAPAQASPTGGGLSGPASNHLDGTATCC